MGHNPARCGSGHVTAGLTDDMSESDSYFLVSDATCSVF